MWPVQTATMAFAAQKIPKSSSTILPIRALLFWNRGIRQPQSAAAPGQKRQKTAEAAPRRRLARLVGPSSSSSHFVTKCHHAALIAFDLGKMKGDISVELLEEAEPITDQDGQDRITNFVG
jgi:hypothetical protein